MKKAPLKKAVKSTAKKIVKAKKKPNVKLITTHKVLCKSPEKHSFVLHDGRKLQSVFELIDELETMSEETFHEYVSDAENHFANWVEHVFDEKVLADEMRRIKNRLDTQRAVLKHLVRALLKEKHEK